MKKLGTVFLVLVVAAATLGLACQGEEGPQGDVGPQGPVGPAGEQGKPGPKGDMPAHEWSGTQLRLQNPDGSWGDYTDILEGEQAPADLANLPLSSGVVWSYGTGIPGSNDGQLFLPHSAEEINGSHVLITDSRNYRLLLIDKKTNEIVWSYGKDDIGIDYWQPLSARKIMGGMYAGHYLVAGRYYDLDAVLYRGFVYIIDPVISSVRWEYDVANASFGDAITWDSDHIMVTDTITKEIAKISLVDKSKPWSYDCVTLAGNQQPTFLQKLKDADCYYGSFGGDLLFGTSGSLVREILTSDKSTQWEYGTDSDGGFEYGDMTYQHMRAPFCALRYGSGEHTNRTPALTFICAMQSCSIFAVTLEKAKVWQIGGVTPSYSTGRIRGASPQGGILLLHPIYVSLTRSANLLIVDSCGNKVIEVSPHMIPERERWEGTVFSKASTDDWVNSEIIESRTYAIMNFMVSNTDAANSANWRILGSPDANAWFEIKPLAEIAAGDSTYYVTTDPWAFVKVQVKSTVIGLSSPNVRVDVHCSANG